MNSSRGPCVDGLEIIKCAKETANPSEAVAASDACEDGDQARKHECCAVIPTKEFLMNMAIVTNLACPVLNCGGVFSNSSALNLHLEKSHRLYQKRELNSLTVTTPKTYQQKEMESCDCKYYCPEPKCKYNIRDGEKKFLPSFYSLKNHFIRMHGNKSFACEKCCKLFSIKSELHRHQEKCGLLFKCSCGCYYSTRNALLKHQRQKGHDQHVESQIAEKTIVKLNGPSFKHGNNARLLSSSIKIKSFDSLAREKTLGLKPTDAAGKNGVNSSSSATPVILALNTFGSSGATGPILILKADSVQTADSRLAPRVETTISSCTTSIAHPGPAQNILCGGSAYSKERGAISSNQSQMTCLENRSISCQTSNGFYPADGFTSETACQTNESNVINQGQSLPCNAQSNMYSEIVNKLPPAIYSSNNCVPQSQLQNNGSSYATARIYLNSQETQTSRSTHRSIATNMLTDEDYLDAATSTSPFTMIDPFGESLWNEISTQTNLSSFQMSANGPINCATNTDELLYCNTGSNTDLFSQLSSKTPTSGVEHTENREIQTCFVSVIDTCTQTKEPNTSTVGVGDSYTTFTCDSTQSVLGHGYFENYSNGNNDSMMSSANRFNADTYYQRCLTPPASTSTTSIHTQTQNDFHDLQNANNFVDMITQTEWNFDF